MEWQVTFYNEKVETETLSFPPGILANFLHIAEMIVEYGPMLGAPYTKPLGEGLFEIRAKGKEGIGRSFFCTVKGKEVIVLHSFIVTARTLKKCSLFKKKLDRFSEHFFQEVRMPREIARINT
ncbi:MAG: type II toxin-antitoxin system RelE/ParE family toxin [Pseudomonadota bacterium]